jgi:hypothetical protein
VVPDDVKEKGSAKSIQKQWDEIRAKELCNCEGRVTRRGCQCKSNTIITNTGTHYRNIIPSDMPMHEGNQLKKCPRCFIQLTFGNSRIIKVGDNVYDAVCKECNDTYDLKGIDITNKDSPYTLVKAKLVNDKVVTINEPDAEPDSPDSDIDSDGFIVDEEGEPKVGDKVDYLYDDPNIWKQGTITKIHNSRKGTKGTTYEFDNIKEWSYYQVAPLYTHTKKEEVNWEPKMGEKVDFYGFFNDRAQWVQGTIIDIMEGFFSWSNTYKITYKGEDYDEIAAGLIAPLYTHTKKEEEEITGEEIKKSLVEAKIIKDSQFVTISDEGDEFELDECFYCEATGGFKPTDKDEHGRTICKKCRGVERIYTEIVIDDPVVKPGQYITVDKDNKVKIYNTLKEAEAARIDQSIPQLEYLCRLFSGYGENRIPKTYWTSQANDIANLVFRLVSLLNPAD